MPEIDSRHEPIIIFKLSNSKPVDLLDLTGSLAAFGEAYSDYVVHAGYDIEPGNVRLFIREIRTWSIIADLVSMADITLMPRPGLFLILIKSCITFFYRCRHVLMMSLQRAGGGSGDRGNGTCG